MAMPDSSSGSEGRKVSPRVTKRGTSKPVASPSCGPFPLPRIVTVSFSLSYVGFLKNWFVVSKKFVADDDVVVEAAKDDATVSLSTNVSIVQQLEKTFSL